jgi:hypothetical protein
MTSARLILLTPRSRDGHIKLTSGDPPTAAEQRSFEGVMQSVRVAVAKGSFTGHGDTHVFAAHRVEQPVPGGLKRTASGEIAVLLNVDVRSMGIADRDRLVSDLLRFLTVSAQDIVAQTETSYSGSELWPSPALDGELKRLAPPALQRAGGPPQRNAAATAGLPVLALVFLGAVALGVGGIWPPSSLQKYSPWRGKPSDPTQPDLMAFLETQCPGSGAVQLDPHREAQLRLAYQKLHIAGGTARKSGGDAPGAIGEGPQAAAGQVSAFDAWLEVSSYRESLSSLMKDMGTLKEACLVRGRIARLQTALAALRHAVSPASMDRSELDTLASQHPDELLRLLQGLMDSHELATVLPPSGAANGPFLQIDDIASVKLFSEKIAPDLMGLFPEAPSLDSKAHDAAQVALRWLLQQGPSEIARKISTKESYLLDYARKLPTLPESLKRAAAALRSLIGDCPSQIDLKSAACRDADALSLFR